MSNTFTQSAFKILAGIIAIFLSQMAPCQAQDVVIGATASHPLGYSGATLSVREGKWVKGTSQLTLILKGPNGRSRTLPLHADGGAAGQHLLMLFGTRDGKFPGGGYLLVSDIDCINIDPLKIAIAQCSSRPQCVNGVFKDLVFAGVFDWETGFDPPHGDFTIRLRFVPPEGSFQLYSC